MSARTRWADLSPRNRRLLVAAAAAEGALKVAALMDLRRRPADQVNGSKRVWALAIAFINSAGAVPVIYFVRGRRHDT